MSARQTEITPFFCFEDDIFSKGQIFFKTKPIAKHQRQVTKAKFLMPSDIVSAETTLFIYKLVASVLDGQVSIGIKDIQPRRNLFDKPFLYPFFGLMIRYKMLHKSSKLTSIEVTLVIAWSSDLCTIAICFDMKWTVGLL